MKAAFFFGTRPEIIKTFPVVRALEEDSRLECHIVHSGQHYDFVLSRSLLEELQMPEPEYHLNIGSGSHAAQAARVLLRLEHVLQELRPDVLVVQGDTNTAMAGALAAVKLGVPVAHIEAGCRSFDWNMPEEINRIVIDSIAAACFAPSDIARENLLYEGKDCDCVFMLGNTAVDACEYILGQRRVQVALPDLGMTSKRQSQRTAVLTLHRSENVDDFGTLSSIVNGLLESPYDIVFPAHPRTVNKLRTFGLLGRLARDSRIRLVGPLSYSRFIELVQAVDIVLTDSGGVQVEAAILGKPCLTLRTTTEWPETLVRGNNILVGTGTKGLKHHLRLMAESGALREKMAKAGNPFVGNAGPRIAKKLAQLAIRGRLIHKQPKMQANGYPRVALLNDLKPKELVYSASIPFDRQGRICRNRNSASSLLARRYIKDE